MPAGSSPSAGSQPHWLQRYIVVLLPGVLNRLVAQHVESAADASARVARQDHLINVAAFGGSEGIGEAVLVFFDTCGDFPWIAKVCPVEDLNCPFGSHDRDLSRRPSVIHIPADMLGAHHVVGAAIGLT